jgi:leucyl aminopeptidase
MTGSLPVTTYNCTVEKLWRNLVMKIQVKEGRIARVKDEIIMVGIFEGKDAIKGAARAVETATAGMITEIIQRGDFKGELYKTFLIHKTQKIGVRRVLLVGLGKAKDCTIDKVRGAASYGARFIRDMGIKHFIVPGSFAQLSEISNTEVIKAVLEGISLGLYTFKEYKTKKDGSPDKVIDGFTILVESNKEYVAIKDATKASEILSRAVYLVRDLVSRPANSATPAFLARTAQTNAKKHRLECRVLGMEQIKKLGMGCFIGVAQGSREPAKFIIIEHKPRKTVRRDTIVLIGKAITFDSGGISLKPAQGMDRMKDDMSGGAAVIGIMQAVAELGIPLHVVGLVPATENLPDGAALKPGDIITSLSGKTVEIITTDAEGRLILADALTYASRYQPAAIIDLATLTGACVIALGNDVAGVMGTNDGLIEKIKQASAITGEKVWQLPLWDEYGELLKSDIADIKNAGGRDAGAITGGFFLKEFADKTPWVHMDIAGPVWTEKDKPYIPKGATGFGVRLIVNLLENWKKDKKGK